MSHRGHRRTRCRGLRSRSCSFLRSGALAQLLTWSLASPRARIDVTNGIEPFLGLFERSEVPHVKTEALAAILAPPAHKETESLQLRNLSLLERHRRRRGAEVEHVRSGLCSPGRRRPCFPGSGACDSTRCQCWRWCHKPSPDRLIVHEKPRCLKGGFVRSAGSASGRARCAIVAAPPS